MKRTILIVEPDLVISALLKRKSSSYEFIFAKSATNALAEVQKLEALFCLVVDFELPEENGIALAQEVRRRFPEVKVILISEFHDLRIKELAEKNNIHNYITKLNFYYEWFKFLGL